MVYFFFQRGPKPQSVALHICGKFLMLGWVKAVKFTKQAKWSVGNTL